MNNKISLSYENGKFNISINEEIIYSDNELESSVEKFKNVIKNSEKRNGVIWNDIHKEMHEYNLESLEINSEYKNLSYKNIKYFYATNKVFYIKEETLIPLLGGYEFFKFILMLVKDKYIKDYEKVLDLCTYLLSKKVWYRTDNMVLSMSSPKFNYGSLEYNFTNGRINKGTSISICTFEDFNNYVMETI
ncbi:MAG: hypothetical protein E7208_09755 [Clostridium butyricum]|nr:hypothetical protein [Clostridium butyricum]